MLELFETSDPKADKTWLVRQLATLLNIYRSNNELNFTLSDAEKQQAITLILKVVRDRLSTDLRNRTSVRGLSKLPAMQARRGATQPQRGSGLMSVALLVSLIASAASGANLSLRSNFFSRGPRGL